MLAFKLKHLQLNALAIAAIFNLLDFHRPAAVCAQSFDLDSMAGQVDNTTSHADRIRRQVQPRPKNLREEALGLDRALPSASYRFATLQPVYMEDIPVKGFSRKSLGWLSFHHFTVMWNSEYVDMVDVYRHNRELGQSNFVTADSIVHPYFAFSNRVLADAIVEHMVPELTALLRSMLQVMLSDYKNSDDAGVRGDIETNIAFLCVGLKLLDSQFMPPAIGRVRSLVNQDLASVCTGRTANSAISDSPMNFLTFQPMGWLASTPELATFYRCKEWLSRMSCPLSDTVTGGLDTKGTTFRRSVLLYRALALAKIGGEPAYDIWLKLARAWPLLGSPLKASQQGTILPPEYKTTFKEASQDLKVTLSSLADPLFRSRLMLSMREHRTVQLDPASISELEAPGRKENLAGAFRLFPVVGDPESGWLRVAARTLQDPLPEDTPAWPLALMVLQCWGAEEASNVLMNGLGDLDDRIFDSLPLLRKATTERTANGKVRPVDDRRWRLLSGYFNVPSASAQEVFRSEWWAIRHLESAFAGWVDSHLALAPQSAIKARGAASGATTTTEWARAAASPPARLAPVGNSFARTASFHYLEPSPSVFGKMVADTEYLQATLSGLGYLDKYQDRLADFSRLGKRLEAIASAELKGQAIAKEDMSLLGNIDRILERVSVPVPAVLNVPASGATSQTPVGVNLALGRPGLIYVILRQGKNISVARGALYTYIEIPGNLISAEHWQRKVKFDVLKPPYWTSKFEFVRP